MLNSLTSFRFIAALMVFVFHAGILSEYQLGAAGVSFFFVLSGFILTFNYHNKINKLNKTNLKQFYKARFAKIYPLHLLTFLIALPITLLYFNPDRLYLIKLIYMSIINLSLIQSFSPSSATYFNFNGVSWTLSVEAFFYLTFPFLIFNIRKLKIHNYKFISILLLTIVWIGLFVLNFNLNESNHFLIWALHIFPVARLFEFITGIVLGLIFVKTQNNWSSEKHSIAEISAVLLFMVALLISVNLHTGAVRGGFFIPVWCILVYIFAHQKGIISRLLSNRLLVYLGEISFSFYMIHQLVIRYYLQFKFVETYMTVVCFVITLILSALTYRFYEEPLRKWIRYGKQKNLLLSNKKASA
ncbi:acyltransferase family protein [Metabacillus bambusae]|uniref:Acyltransferase n=1 Tax=Metabacillus bambusae TaxID=2795218 RepID=A0ABS3N257_9BACI|nr:acyltransferase [Metabacillus bambusae]MBO1512371.1 acyltransferase [Metabacillus bambusae]